MKRHHLHVTPARTSPLAAARGPLDWFAGYNRCYPMWGRHQQSQRSVVLDRLGIFADDAGAMRYRGRRDLFHDDTT